LQLSTREDRVRIDGMPAPPDGSNPGVDVHLQDVSGGYFDALRMPLVAGRAFRRTDDATAPRVAVINETFASRAWPAGGALGRTFAYEGHRVTVVGVAHDAKYSSLTETTPMFLFLPIAQEWQSRQTVMVRARDAASAPALAQAIQRAVHDIDPEAPRPEVVTMRQATSFVLLPQRVAAVVAGSLGLTGLLLAAVGLYGIIAYSVGRRSREIGVRMALGASASRVQWMVVREGLRLALTGVAIGLVMAAGASRLLVSFLYGVSPLDAVTFVGMSAVLTGVAAMASYLPARRAARADPVAALRME
jgi:predicted permease